MRIGCVSHRLCPIPKGTTEYLVFLTVSSTSSSSLSLICLFVNETESRRFASLSELQRTSFVSAFASDCKTKPGPRSFSDQVSQQLRRSSPTRASAARRNKPPETVLWGGNRRAFPLFVAPVKDLRFGHLLPLCALRLLQPGLQDRLQCHHVIVRQCQGLEPTDGTLAQTPNPGDLEVSQGRSYISLSHSKFDPSLFEPFSKRLQLARIGLRIAAGVPKGTVGAQPVWVHVHGLWVVVGVVLHVVDGRHVGGVSCVRGRGADIRAGHASQRNARCEVIQQVAFQALCWLVVPWVVVGGEHRWVVQVRGGRSRCAGHAGHCGHGVVGRVWLERVALLGHNVHSSQGLGSLQQRLIKTGEDVALKLREKQR